MQAFLRQPSRLYTADCSATLSPRVVLRTLAHQTWPWDATCTLVYGSETFQLCHDAALDVWRNIRAVINSGLRLGGYVGNHVAHNIGDEEVCVQLDTLFAGAGVGLLDLEVGS